MLIVWQHTMLKYIIILCVALVFFEDRILSLADNICGVERNCSQHNECKTTATYCCNKQGQDYRNGYCCSSCIGQSCLIDEDCGRNECCHDRKCVRCSSLRCSSNLVCGLGYCCKAGSRNSRCFPNGCVGHECDSSEDCGAMNECCRNKKCVECFSSTCKDDAGCRFGHHCCREARTPICSRSCIREFCISNEECAGNGTCCIENKCTTDGCPCGSNSDCAHERYCCTGDPNPACSIHCIGKQCSSDSDCGRLEEICTCPNSDCINTTKYTNPRSSQLPSAKCFKKNGCSSHGECKRTIIGKCLSKFQYFSRIEEN
ncbi:keratin-associated protein 10-2-like [Dendronephthya gigantea]|uniref:keratin-associated protein 10-2-like n=1 Tax=Dendronephthya gigantea TaxID=151771 RepID=UPI00106D29C5|nr:keratin-associated protein 10-2-like [Dendronephthya gigantea]